MSETKEYRYSCLTPFIMRPDLSLFELESGQGANSLSYDFDDSRARIVENAITATGTTNSLYLGSQYVEVITKTDASVTPTVTSKEYKHYIASPDGIVALVTVRSTDASNNGDPSLPSHVGNSANNVGIVKYWLKDHLGSITAEFEASNPAGALQRLSFDAWG